MKGKKDLKDYSNKTPLESLQWKAIQEIGRVFAYAKKKYGNVDSWREFDKDTENRYKGALLRHLLNYINGVKIDAESGLPHLLMAGWNVLTLIEYEIESSTQNKIEGVR